VDVLGNLGSRLLPKVQAPPEWGIEPVAAAHRTLGWIDYFVLWGDLGVGLLVLLAGSFLVPGLGLGSALLAILIGSVLGCLVLALIGVVGSDNAVPTMVLLRPVLGVRGSYLPTALNVLQLIGWTVFELVVMGYAANTISRTLLGVSSYALWAGVFAAIVVLMGVGGPVGVVRQWLEKFAVWVVFATTAWLTFRVLTSGNLPVLWAKPGDGSLPFWVAVDLVIALPISWLPLVADYSRFARKTSSAFWGTFFGYVITNVWFYALGVMLLLTAGVMQQPKEFVSAIALTAGWVALLILLVDETDNAWADLYSAAVSIQNVFPRVRQRWLLLGLGAVAYFAALAIDITQYESFLLLTGSLFIPLFGVLAADYFAFRRRRYEVDELSRRGGAYWYSGGVNVWGLVAWVVGIIVYNLANPTTLGAFVPAWLSVAPASLTAFGGSVPSFVAAFVVYAAFGLMFVKPGEGEKHHATH
jgi:nucleobase:cation symporter-1, NCS1 family